MSSLEDNAKKNEDEGSPAWVMTFADLMSLLMCFFVLLLSFAELDIIKFKQIAGSMKVAFGVQRDVIAPDVPKGTSIIMQEFSAGRPDPTEDPAVRQQTTDIEKERLEVLVDGSKEEGEEVSGINDSLSDSSMEEKQQTQAEETAKKIEEELEVEIEQKKIEIETEDKKIIIRILEQAAFQPARAEFNYAFFPILDKIRSVLAEVKGKVLIVGHTDDTPIKTDRFRSNWELSSARAVSVAHALLEFSDLHPDRRQLDPKRFIVQGVAGTQPLVKNVSEKNRSKNRRVEIVIEQEPKVKKKHQSKNADGGIPQAGVAVVKPLAEQKAKREAERKSGANIDGRDIPKSN